MKMANLLSVLEFLNKKANVIHCNLLINNIMINQVWDHRPNNSPTQLCNLISAKANIIPDVSNGPNDSMSQLEPVSNVAIVQTPAISASVIQGPAPSPAVSTIDYGGTFEPIEAAGMIIDCNFM